MKNIILLIIGLTFLGTSYAQFGSREERMKMANRYIEKKFGEAKFYGGTFEQVQELQKSKLYVYIVKSNSKAIIEANNYYMNAIEKSWNFSEVEVIDKEKYKQLKNDKDSYFLTNKIVPKVYMKTGGYGGAARVHVGRILSLTKGQPKLKTSKIESYLFGLKYIEIRDKKKIGENADVFYEKLITSDIKLMNNYLKDCIAYNTIDGFEIAKKNAINLKGKNLGFPQKMVSFTESDLGKSMPFDAVFIKGRNIPTRMEQTKEYKAVSKEKEIHWLKLITATTFIITDSESRICYYAKMQDFMNPVLTYSQLQELVFNMEK